MSQVTRFNGNYTFQGVDTSSNVQVNAHTLVVNANLKVLGTVTNVAATNTQITDAVITFNQGETGSGVTYVYNGRSASGIEIDRGSLPKVAIIWNEGSSRWELTSDGSTYLPLTAGASGITEVQDDPAPILGGNLDVASNAIFSSTAEIIKHDTNVAIQNSSIAPSYYSGYNVVYAQAPAGGGSGLFITNSTTQQQELVTKTKAIVYALIM
jgi:hypothetical protein